MMGEDKQITCFVEDGRFVRPCSTLSDAVDNPAAAFSKGKGITRWEYTNLRDLKSSRIFFGVKSKAFSNGLLFNYCPFCGADISAPFQEDTPPPQTARTREME